jgi:uncharacterized repeat protein (TIGR04076 family)
VNEKRARFFGNFSAEVFMYQVKMTVVDILGDESKYPCHFKYKIGDEFIWDGEKFIGKLCAALIPLVMPKIMDLHAAGPRYVNPLYYYPFFYAPVSEHDEASKEADGLGFKNVLKNHDEPKYHMATLTTKNAYKWPPHPERNVARSIRILCPDLRTAVAVSLEAFDISECGYDVPYFRRQMAILNKVLRKPGVATDKILGEFSREENEGIYPALSPIMVQALYEELELMGYLEIKEGKAFVPEKGNKKFQEYKAGLTAGERKANYLE